MKATELRIGNWVTTDKDKIIFVDQDVDVVFSIDTDRIELFSDGNYGSSSYCRYFDVEEVKPIPLTEDWLVRFGFYNLYDATFQDKNCVRVRNNNGAFWWLSNDELEEVRLDFVHHFQNLYFCHTGEELVLNEPKR